jgi:catechol 2,3-dioxygenase-like lactoylglutathione lyase family enzyme
LLQELHGHRMTQAPTDPQAPILDHVVADVRDRMDEAVALYRRLGFHMTPRGKHTLGSINHLAIFHDNYFELLGFEKGATEVRADIMRFPVGLNGLVFRSEDSAATYQAMRRNGVEIQEPLEFHRPVDLAGGGREDARFRVVRLPPGTLSGGRLYFCHHLTKHLVWRDEWRSHPNGAVNIAGITMVAPDPAAVAALFEKMFGAAALRHDANGTALELANARVEILAPQALARRYGAAAPDPAGRGEYLAALTVRTSGIAKTAQALAGFPGVASQPGRVVVDATEAFNVTLEFVE